MARGAAGNGGEGAVSRYGDANNLQPWYAAPPALLAPATRGSPELRSGILKGLPTKSGTSSNVILMTWDSSCKFAAEYQLLKLASCMHTSRW